MGAVDDAVHEVVRDAVCEVVGNMVSEAPLGHSLSGAPPPTIGTNVPQRLHELSATP